MVMFLSLHSHLLFIQRTSGHNCTVRPRSEHHIVQLTDFSAGRTESGVSVMCANGESKADADAEGDLDQAVPHGDGGRLGAVHHAQLVEDAGDVGLHGPPSDKQRRGDLAVGASRNEQPENIHFARS